MCRNYMIFHLGDVFTTRNEKQSHDIIEKECKSLYKVIAL